MSFFVEEAEPSHAGLSGNKRQKLTELEYLTDIQPTARVL